MTISLEQNRLIEEMFEFVVPEQQGFDYISVRNRLKDRVVYVIKVYSSSTSLSSIVNFFKAAVSGSDWIKAKAELLPFMQQGISLHYSGCKLEGDQKKQAEVLTEFFLRYHVKYYCVKNKIPTNIILDEEWKSQSLESIEVENFLEQAIHGDGTRLGKKDFQEFAFFCQKEICQLKELESKINDLEPDTLKEKFRDCIVKNMADHLIRDIEVTKRECKKLIQIVHAEDVSHNIKDIRSYRRIQNRYIELLKNYNDSLLGEVFKNRIDSKEKTLKVLHGIFNSFYFSAGASAASIARTKKLLDPVENSLNDVCEKQRHLQKSSEDLGTQLIPFIQFLSSYALFFERMEDVEREFIDVKSS